MVGHGQARAVYSGMGQLIPLAIPLGRVWQAEERQRLARRGVARADNSGMNSFMPVSLDTHGGVRHGKARLAQAWTGEASRGTEGQGKGWQQRYEHKFIPVRLAPTRHASVGLGAAWSGAAGHRLFTAGQFF